MPSLRSSDSLTRRDKVVYLGAVLSLLVHSKLKVFEVSACLNSIEWMTIFFLLFLTISCVRFPQS